MSANAASPRDVTLPLPGGAVRWPAVVQLTDFSRIYPGAPPLTAVRIRELTIERGELIVIRGPSGSGKTTLLGLLGLVDRPSTGRYLLNGFDVARLGERDRSALRARQIGMVYQDCHLLPGRSAVANVGLALLYSGMTAQRRLIISTDMLELVGLANRARALPTELSRGERQRVAIARALASRPNLLLLDEPTVNLDPDHSAGVLELLSRLPGEGYTVVIANNETRRPPPDARTVTLRAGLVADAGVRPTW